MCQGAGHLYPTLYTEVTKKSKPFPCKKICRVWLGSDVDKAVAQTWGWELYSSLSPPSEEEAGAALLCSGLTCH